MKKKSKIIWGISILLILLIGPALPFLFIKGQYTFSEFWQMFFTKIFSWDAFVGAFVPIISAIPTTLEITIIAMFFGLVSGLLLALVKINKIPLLNQIRALFVSFIRGTPIIVQLFLTYTGLPLILKAINMNYGTSFNINAIPASLLVMFTFALNEAAYNSETIRSAIQSVDKGQIEAAKALGMTSVQTFKRVIIPEAATVATAPLGNALLGLLKSTSLAFVAGVVEMTAKAQIIGGSSLRIFEPYLALAVVYWAICIVIEVLIHQLEKKLEIKSPDGKNKNSARISLSENPFSNQ
ncbi:MULTISPECIES: amino acid ABC transporter permease [unclassified Lactococcus]|uniref:amino acid ABC transporter permease n=1 Tax=unclassified Lactococcus TaxID=2643510 RepID=UPI0011CC77F2|nr:MULTISPECIES: amino acid ABC transporter permease [unclassified Lactococcus]MQW23292.1 ABC transporter permease subunit [Lactococcus sp. dk101]TXK38042.1 amino acid ABC transporter permease [Lactococcus sp. dk310]TXK49721.1 amino acid ABC transporter permease [Lactococcus sp. dk322]